MAKIILNEDFLDSILSPEMNGMKQYQMINNANGTVSFEDVTKYVQEGSEFGAAEVNKIAKAVNENTPDTVDTLAEVETLTKAGYLPDALTVKELNKRVTDYYSNFSNARSALESALTGHGVTGIAGANFTALIAAVKKLKVISSVSPTQIYPDTGNLVGGWSGTPSLESAVATSLTVTTKKAISLDEINSLNIDTYTYHRDHMGTVGDYTQENGTPNISVSLRSTSGSTSQVFAKQGSYGSKSYGINVSTYKGSYFIDIKVGMAYPTNSAAAQATVSKMTML